MENEYNAYVNELHWAAMKGDAKVVEKLLNTKPYMTEEVVSNSIFCKGSWNEGCTPLHLAAFAGHVDVAKLLLEHNPKLIAEVVQGSCWKGFSAIHLATLRSRVPVLNFLLEYDSSLAVKPVEKGGCASYVGFLPLHVAIRQISNEALEVLLDHSPETASKIIRNNNYIGGFNALHLATRHINGFACELLLNIDPSLKMSRVKGGRVLYEGLTPLELAKIGDGYRFLYELLA